MNHKCSGCGFTEPCREVALDIWLCLDCQRIEAMQDEDPQAILDAVNALRRRDFFSACIVLLPGGRTIVALQPRSIDCAVKFQGETLFAPLQDAVAHAELIQTEVPNEHRNHAAAGLSLPAAAPAGLQDLRAAGVSAAEQSARAAGSSPASSSVQEARQSAVLA